jgi:hypothetical protein
MRAWRLVYWAFTGALLGLGLVELPGLGLILFPVGVALLGIGLAALRGQEMVAGIFGFGALPEAAFLNAILILGVSGTGSRAYYWGAILFGAITLAGLVVLAVAWRAQAPTGRATQHSATRRPLSDG